MFVALEGKRKYFFAIVREDHDALRTQSLFVEKGGALGAN